MSYELGDMINKDSHLNKIICVFFVSDDLMCIFSLQ